MRAVWTRLIVVISLIAVLVPAPQPASAALSSCNLGISPHSVAPDSDTGFSVGLYNGDSNPIRWLQITRPAGDYLALNSGSAWSWSASVTADTVTFTGGSLPNGYSQGFDVDATARHAPGGPADWKVQISDDPSGASPVTCGGDLSLTIEVQPSVINLSNVRASDVSDSSVTVLWDTDVASNSKVSYSQDTSYSSSSSVDQNLVTSHSVTLRGLAPNTGYHYLVTSATPADGGTVSSADNTFLTAVTPATGGGGSAGTGPANVPGVTPKPAAAESAPPTVRLTTVLGKPYAKAPTITGTATDNDAVARVEYSVDGGKNWLPVDHVTVATKGSVSFSFTPMLTEDGDYPVVIRAFDASGNPATTPASILVIDRLPPQVGGAIISVGPNITVPSEAGIVGSLVGIEQAISLSAIGGPTAVTLRAKPLFGAGDEQSFALVRSPDTGLWSGIMSFQAVGAYTVAAEAVDGAGNQSSRTLVTVNVATPPAVTNRATHRPVEGAKVSVYALDPSTKQWHLWDAGPYDQVNPQVLDQDGAYRYVLPAGKYYVKAEASGYRPLFSRIFELTKPTPLSTPLELNPSRLPVLLADRATITPAVPKLKAAPIGIAVGATPRPFTLQNLSGQTIRSIDLNGQPTVITVLATWHPSSSEQLPALAAAQTNADVNVIPVAEQERTGQARVFLGRSGLKLSLVADPDGIITDRLGAVSYPTHYFLDRSGVVRQIVTGVLSRDQIMSHLQGL